MDAMHAITESSLLVASKNASLLTRPTRKDSRRSIADEFFFVELRSSLGSDEAHEWLKTQATTSCCRSRSRSRSSLSVSSEASTRASSPCAVRRTTSVHQMLPKAGPSSERIKRTPSGLVEFIIQEHGSNAGLLFTDAAHQLLDSPPASPGADATARETAHS